MSKFRPKASKVYEPPIRVRRHKVAEVVIDGAMSGSDYMWALSDAYYAETTRVLDEFSAELRRFGESKGRIVFEMPSGMFGHVFVNLEGER
jgi:hypothetical protein